MTPTTTRRKSSGQAKAKSSAAQAKPKTLRQRFSDWPSKGYDGPQPWDFDALGVRPDDVKPGEPIDLNHGRPLLTSGSGGEHVREVARRLEVLGYESSISRGQNPFDTLDESVLQAVEQFRQDHGVAEAPEPFGGNTAAGRQLAAAHVGPYTWAALIRAADRKA